MKKIYLILLVLLAAGSAFTSWTVDDNPRIIAPTFPERDENGGLGTISEIDRDVLFSITVTTTPADYTSVVWTLDGENVGTEKTLEMNLEAGIYHLRVDVSTPVGKTTFREGLVKIKALARIVVPGGWARLSGTNLDKVAKVALKQINVSESKSNPEVEISDVTYVESGAYIEFKIPAGLADGEYRVAFVDVKGNAKWTLTGLNMDKVASLSLGGNAITTFVEQYSTRLTFVSPIVADGDYVLTGITSDGESVNFFVEDEIKTELAVTVKDSPSEVELWKGHYYVSWEAGASESAKEFGEVKTMIQDLPLGSKLKIYYTIEPNDTYHQIGTKTAYWTDLPGYPESVFSEDGVVC